MKAEEQSKHPAHHQRLLSLLPGVVLVSSTPGLQDAPRHMLCAMPEAVTPGVGQRLPLTPVLCWKTPGTAELASLVQMSDGSEGEDGTSHAFTSVNRGNKTCIWEPPLRVALSKHWSWLNTEQSCACPLNSRGIREGWLDFRVSV